MHIFDNKKLVNMNKKIIIFLKRELFSYKILLNESVKMFSD